MLALNLQRLARYIGRFDSGFSITAANIIRIKGKNTETSANMYVSAKIISAVNIIKTDASVARLVAPFGVICRWAVSIALSNFCAWSCCGLIAITDSAFSHNFSYSELAIVTDSFLNSWYSLENSVSLGMSSTLNSFLNLASYSFSMSSVFFVI